MAYPFQNLVFEGGGVKGIAYAGALEALESRGILSGVTRVGGTSAGAITALLVGLNYSTKEIRDVLGKLDFKKFLDDSFGVVRDTERLIQDFGWYKGDYLAAQKGAKGFRDLYFMGTNLSTNFGEVFSAEHTPRMCVADAVRISMSIPLFFAAKRSLRGDVYVDGGVLDNYPVKLFDREKYVSAKERYEIPDYYKKHNAQLQRAGKGINPYVFNKETLGFRLDSASEIAVFRDHAEPAHQKIDDFFDYIKALMGTIMAVQEGYHLHSDDWQRTIYIDTLGVGTTDFEISNAKKTALMKSGKDGAETYFKWYDDPASRPLNRVG
ncbi:MAG: patatin-like phospholipase family protein [Nitrospirae bacterium]|nr:patatin-like phospholipase family protein [Nitrospirota bacterium]